MLSTSQELQKSEREGKGRGREGGREREREREREGGGWGVLSSIYIPLVWTDYVFTLSTVDTVHSSHGTVQLQNCAHPLLVYHPLRPISGTNRGLDLMLDIWNGKVASSPAPHL